MKSFSLIPFNSDTAPAIAIDGEIQREHNQLRIEYRLKEASQIIIPQKSDRAIRQYDLWEHTCFELFVKLQDSTKYWEFNLSPAEHWNVFRFPNYRQDIAEEMDFSSLPFKVLSEDNSLRLNLAVDLDKIISSKTDLEVGITTVVEDKQQLSYWALTHPANEADFHHFDSFIIKL